MKFTKEHRRKLSEAHLKRFKHESIFEKIPGIKLDNEDVERVEKFVWHKDIGGYAVRHVPMTKGKKRVFLHHFILPRKKGHYTDHINRDRLDNRKCNLRYVSPRLNAINSGIRKDNTSGYIGVRQLKHRKNLWVSEVHVYGKKITEYSRNLKDAIKKRKELVIKYY